MEVIKTYQNFKHEKEKNILFIFLIEMIFEIISSTVWLNITFNNKVKKVDINGMFWILNITPSPGTSQIEILVYFYYMDTSDTAFLISRLFNRKNHFIKAHWS